MAEDDDTLPERYNHLKDLLDKIGKEADTEKRLTIIEQHYQKKDDISKMIWSAIATNETNNNKNRINCPRGHIKGSRALEKDCTSSFGDSRRGRRCTSNCRGTRKRSD